jgi:anaerobic magnesium-protoporphyrin IX monomethyl ester cyclase
MADMRVLLVNPPYQTLTSNVGVGHQVPLGLLMVGGPLLGAGHHVELLDAECHRLTTGAIVGAVEQFGPDMVLSGHAGSTPAHPVCMEMFRAIKVASPHVVTVYGGVYPTYHAERILNEESAVDVIVRGEGEATTVELAEGVAFSRIAGIAYRADGQVVLTPERPVIHDLDAYRVGWELIRDWSNYSCFGLGRAAIVQFSRGCPHRCTYCGQHGFWVRWRHRDPVRLADEIEWLYRTHDVRFITLADENPTTLRSEWQRFLEELARRRMPVYFFATIRATDIVRDADLLQLYQRAGILYVLMGIESTNGNVLKHVNKGSTTRRDLQACRLLKEHGIFSVMGHIVGLEDETWATFRHALAHLSEYDGDWLNAMYVTPHSWTEFGREAAGRSIVEPDQRKWDYRHQVLGQNYLRPWQLFVGVKWLELCFHLRPRRLWAILRTRDRFRRRQLFWCLLHTGRVWVGEVVEFLRDGLRRRRLHPGSLAEAVPQRRRGRLAEAVAPQGQVRHPVEIG